MRFWAVSTRNASRTVARLTPNSRARTASFGRRAPGGSSPETISSRSWSFTCSYAFRTRRTGMTSPSLATGRILRSRGITDLVLAELPVAGDRDGIRLPLGRPLLEVPREAAGAVPGRAKLLPEALGRLRVDLERPLVPEDDAVRLLGELERCEIVEDVLADELGVALERVAVAGGVRLDELDEVAGGEGDAGHLGLEVLLVCAVRVLAARGDEPVPAAEDAPRRVELAGAPPRGNARGGKTGGGGGGRCP